MELEFRWYIECGMLKVGAQFVIDGVTNCIRMDVPEKLQKIVKEQSRKELAYEQECRDALRSKDKSVYA